jgi:predicted metal-dependent hydrolase
VFDFEYEIKRNKRISANTSIKISPAGKVIVSAPTWVPVFIIRKFVEDKADWIRDHLSKLPKTKENKGFSSGDKLLFFGEEIELEINNSDKFVRTKFDFIDGKFKVDISSIHTGEKYHQEIRTSMERWYMEQGIAVITEKVNRFAQIIGVDYSKITIKKVSSIWGSCSYQNNLSFSRKLIMAPHVIVDYVVIHEVCHMVHRNHSSHFWGLVCKLDPSFRQHRHWLKLNSHLLSI